MRSAEAEHQSESPVAIARWIGEDGEPLEHPQLPESGDPTEVLVDVGHWLAHRVDAARGVKAASGPRLGPPIDQTRRTGSKEEVVAPLLIRPNVALRAAIVGEIFTTASPRLQIERDSLRASGSSWSWRASVKTGVFRRRVATLRIGPSPSGNLTILQLVPERPRRFRTGSFVRAGIPAIDDLCDRLALQSSILQNR